MYRFRLDRVLNYRQRRKELLEQDFQETKRILEEAEEQLQQLKKSYQTLDDQLTDTRETGVLSEELQALSRYRHSLEQRVAIQQNLVAERRAVLMKKRQALLRAYQETRVLEKMRERDWRRYQQKLGRQEQQFLDELAVMRGWYEE